MPLDLALDQNFPEPVLDALARFVPEVRLVPLRRIHQALPDMPDRQLLLALDKLGWAGLVSNNYKMLQNPSEVAAMLQTKLTMFMIEGLGHDPIRAAGAVLLDLPSAVRRRVDGKAQVFWMRPRSPVPQEPWDLFSRAAERQHRVPSELYQELRVTDDEREQLDIDGE
jgi:hypothetical protein